MSSISARRQDAVLQAISPGLEAEGFEVFLHPSRGILPPFLVDARPDAIALKPDRKLAIEVLTTSLPDGRLDRLSALLSTQPDWELRVIYAPPATATDIPPASSRAVIEAQLAKVGEIFEVAGAAAGLLLAWAGLEAAARGSAPARFAEARTLPQLLEALAAGGYIMPAEAERLRHLARLRDAVAHGHLDVTLDRAALDEMVRISRGLLALRAKNGTNRSAG